MPDLAGTAAYGRDGWSPRTVSLRDEIGMLWGRCGLRDEWGPLRAVLLHRPGPELAVPDPDAAQLLAPVDPSRAAAEHVALAEAYREEGVLVRERFFEKAGLACRTTPVAELRKAAGGIGCLTGILERTPGG